ncbi:hypothetical protein GCM10025866_25110 [Naasia aerilata]|uniref:Uncharacterized protein n=1 Tax=Naasia aerilata TaxID=1162966 RepID=A0ABN6XNN8_9MICO|nr:hypothetical protein GCM10025866_25110 [Naasia aerilata]
MPSVRKQRSEAAGAGALVLGRAARIEDGIQEFREQWARRRGLQPTVIPYTGYGAPGWVRVLGRVLLTRETASRRPTVRGWRSFTTVAVNDIDVIVSVGGQEHTVHADRGGVIDARVESTLEPGWHTVTMRPHEHDRDTSVPVEAKVYVHDPASGFGIISDIDDTIMVTALPGPSSPPGTRSCSTSTPARRPPGCRCSTTASRSSIPARPSSTCRPARGTSRPPSPGS